jgi:hypothetical protein
MSEGMVRVPGCTIFAAGTHRGKTYSVRDLDRMVENFRRFSTGPKALLHVPAVIGHDEDDEQEFLNRTDLPAAGWASRVWRDGNSLKADFEDVAPKIARLIRNKRYRKVSSEVYDDCPEGIPGKGRMLRRVALLGGDIPAIKGLDDIPLPESHSEGARLRFAGVRRSAVPGAFWVFSEVTTMLRPRPDDDLPGKLRAMTGQLHDLVDDVRRDVDAASNVAAGIRAVEKFSERFSDAQFRRGGCYTGRRDFVDQCRRLLRNGCRAEELLGRDPFFTFAEEAAMRPNDDDADQDGTPSNIYQEPAPDDDSDEGREDIIRRLTDHGFSRDLLDGAGDALLAEILRVIGDLADHPGGGEDEEMGAVRDYAERNQEGLKKCGLSVEKFCENFAEARKGGFVRRAADILPASEVPRRRRRY